MTSRDFCFWLQGLFEVGKVEKLDAAQVKIVREHLDWVFEHEIAPEKGKPAPDKADMKKLMDEVSKVRQSRPTMIC